MAAVFMLCLKVKSQTVMKSLTIITYSVIFSQDFTHLGINYYAKVEYQFTVAEQGTITHPADIFDAACSNYFKLFGLSDEKGNYIRNSSDISYSDPTIVSAKEMIVPEEFQSSPLHTAVVTISGNRTYSIEYQTLSDLSESIWTLVIDANSQFECTVAIPSGETYSWNASYAHYCFAKGRITIDEFVNLQFSKEAQL